MFTRSLSDMQMKSHSSCCKFNLNARYFIGYLKLKFFLPSDSYQSNPLSVVLNILRQVLCN